MVIRLRGSFERDKMNRDVINLAEKLALFQDHWSPRVIGEMNDYQFKLVKAEGSLSGTITQIRARRFWYWMAPCGSNSETVR